MIREEAKREIESLDYYLQNHTDDYSEESHTAMMMAVKALEQEPKTGHWIHFAQSDDCSECRWSTGKYISPSKYCPNCGARMIEPQAEKE